MLRPYHQGKLDGLCGIYATINAMRLVCNGQPQRCTLPGKALFEACLVHIESIPPLSDVVADGMSTLQLLSCLRLVKKYLQTKRNIRIRITRPLVGSGLDRLDGVIKALRQFLTTDHRSVLIGYSDWYGGHWTVIQSVGPSHFNLADSAGASRMMFSRLTYRDWRTASANRKRDLGPTSIIFLERVVDDG
jgi:hypothetical protein